MIVYSDNIKCYVDNADLENTPCFLQSFELTKVTWYTLALKTMILELNDGIESNWFFLLATIQKKILGSRCKVSKHTLSCIEC